MLNLKGYFISNGLFSFRLLLVEINGNIAISDLLED
jgi:hypothetical protein